MVLPVDALLRRPGLLRFSRPGRGHRRTAGPGLYYSGLMLVGFVCRRRPVLAPWLGMAESALNLTLLFLVLLVPIWSVAETGVVPAPEMIRARTLNVALSGAVLVWAFYRQRAQAEAALPWR